MTAELGITKKPLVLNLLKVTLFNGLQWVVPYHDEESLFDLFNVSETLTPKELMFGSFSEQHHNLELSFPYQQAVCSIKLKNG